MHGEDTVNPEEAGQQSLESLDQLLEHISPPLRVSTDVPLMLLNAVKDTYMTFQGLYESLQSEIDNLEPHELQDAKDGFWENGLEALTEIPRSVTRLLSQLGKHKNLILEPCAPEVLDLFDSSIADRLIAGEYTKFYLILNAISKKIRTGHTCKREQAPTLDGIAKLLKDTIQHWDDHKLLHSKTPDTETPGTTRRNDNETVNTIIQQYNTNVERILEELRARILPLYQDLVKKIGNNAAITLAPYVPAIHKLREELALTGKMCLERGTNRERQERISHLQATANRILSSSSTVGAEVFERILKEVDVSLLTEDEQGKILAQLTQARLISQDISIAQCKIQLLQLNEVCQHQIEERDAPSRQELQHKLLEKITQSTGGAATQTLPSLREAHTQLSHKGEPCKKRAHQAKEGQPSEPSELQQQLNTQTNKLAQCLKEKEGLEETLRRLSGSIGETAIPGDTAIPVSKQIETADITQAAATVTSHVKANSIQ